MRRVLLIHPTVISPTAETVDLVMHDHAVADVYRAVIWHFPVLDEEDVAALGFRPRRHADKSFISVVLVEDVVVPRVPGRNMQVGVCIQLNVKFTL
ncbi:Uncharacterised protein [Klebsiella pneumoniae]|nr:Uncharacterised protein [Klebsiella pneumoniae]